MSVENFDGNGFADQPSIIYSLEKDDSGEVQIRELARSGFGQAGHSLGDVIERETTKSDPTDTLTELEFLGHGDYARNNYRGCCRVSTHSAFSSDDPAKARTKPSDGSNYLNIRYIGLAQVQQKLKDKRLKKPHTTTSTQTWPVSARCGSRMCCFFGNRNKRLASGSGYADCRVPLAGRS
jgi:hypothetical protein